MVSTVAEEARACAFVGVDEGTCKGELDETEAVDVGETEDDDSEELVTSVVYLP